MLMAPEWFVNEYRANVRHVFQSKGFKLKSTVLPEGRMEGKTAFWPIMGTFEMQEKQRGGQTPPANPNQSMRSADLKDYDALYEIHQQDLSKMTANEKAAAQEAGGNAVGRKVDSVIMNAMNDAMGEAGAPATIGNGSGDFGLPDAMLACDQLQDDDQIDWDGNVTAVIPWRWYNRLLMWKEFNNAEWVGAAGLGFPSGTIGKRWNNVNWLPFQKKELIIPTSNQAYGFIYHRNAIGYSSNYEGAVTMGWDNRAGCWTVRFDLQATAKAIYDKAAGIRRLHFATNSAIERPVERTQAVA